MTSQFLQLLWAAVAITFPSASLCAQPDHVVHRAASQSTFTRSENLPACVVRSIQDGDPKTGPAVILLRFQRGCVVPWHWHTPNERLIILRGTFQSEMKDSSAVVLHAGDFFKLPAKHMHQVTALTEVELFNIPDAPFDIHYVDAQGKEIPVGEALLGRQ